MMNRKHIQREEDMTKKLITLIVCLATILLVSCAPSPQAIQTAIAETQMTNPIPSIASTATPYPTYTLYPTNNTYPTYTLLPSLEPKVIFVTATAPPDFTQIYQFSGKGKGTTDLFSL
jgi:hypothetical protein